MATGRRGRKTTAKRKPKRKAAPARKKKARAKGPSKKKRTKAKATKRKPARKTATRKVKKTKPQGARSKMVRRMRRPAAAAAPPPIPEAAPVPEPHVAPIPRAIPAAPPDDMEVAVERELRLAGYQPPDPMAIAVLAAIGRGYAKGPASPPAWLHVEVARPIAEVLVERFAIGDRAHDIDRGSHRPTTRATVNIVLSQTPGNPVGDRERAVLASFCLGSWDPATDENAERNAIAGFVIPWYMAGRA